uniref:Protein FAR1-RELATED SEQUENCE n=1 Tax=Chenopodium quinoa TaxID=63459 RepID=A0A803NC71_CHEQI
MWIPTAMKHMFWAGMKTTQRNTGLCDFAERYVRATEHRIEAERLADGNSAMYLRTLLTDFKIEETFRNVYTDAKFVEVQRECKRLMYCNCNNTKEIEEGLYEHLIKDRVYIYSDIEKKEKPIDRWRIYRVLYNAKTEELECECRLFECNGILCRHCINALKSQQIPDVPKKYILDRWRRDNYRKHTRVKVAYHDLSKTEEVLRYDKMMVAFEPISCLECENDEALIMVIDGLQQLEMQIKKVVKPALPMSSVGGQLADCGEDDHAKVNVELPVDGGIKDLPTNRGPCVLELQGL